MSLSYFIDNLINLDYDITDTNILKLRQACSDLKSVLDDIYSSSPSRASRKNYNSMFAKRYIHTKIRSNPDLFYSFQHDNTSICIVNIRSHFFVKIIGFDVSLKTVQTVLDSKLFNIIDLFNDSQLLRDVDLSDIDSVGAKIYGGYPLDNLSDCVILFNCVVGMYLDYCSNHVSSNSEDF